MDSSSKRPQPYLEPGKKLRQLRITRPNRPSQETIAGRMAGKGGSYERVLGLRRNIINWEQGYHRPNEESMHLLAAALEVPYARILALYESGGSGGRGETERRLGNDSRNPRRENPWQGGPPMTALPWEWENRWQGSPPTVGDAVVNAANGVFHEREESINGLRVRLAIDVHLRGVADTPMDVALSAKPLVHRVFVGVDGAFA